ncbi:TPA: GNAT family N-acetyltransferase, partial [Escherichia coli]|nr:GNAT family N-acetyltransferase [Escherichia coli]
LYLLINQNKINFIKSMAWPAFVNNISDSVSFIEQSMIDNQNEKALILFIKYKTKIAGVVSFNIIDHANKTAYIGYWLGANFQGKGIVTNAINKLIQEYGDSGVIKRFVIKCIVDNKKSNATALRCGFTLEGVLQKAEILNGVSYD